MKRNQFLWQAGLSMAGLFLNVNAFPMQQVLPRELYFKDDGQIPNSKYPLLLYKNVFGERGTEGAAFIEEKFALNKWFNSWRWGVYPFHHYHSNTHEVLGVFIGEALLHLGGEKGSKVKVQAGDIIVIPAGVGHKCLTQSDDFTVVGAYPNGLSPDLNKGVEGERPTTDRNIAAVNFPGTDPLLGSNDGLVKLWK